MIFSSVVSMGIGLAMSTSPSANVHSIEKTTALHGFNSTSLDNHWMDNNFFLSKPFEPLFDDINENELDELVNNNAPKMSTTKIMKVKPVKTILPVLPLDIDEDILWLDNQEL